MEIKVYTTPTCPWCQKVKDWLKQKNVSFEEINVIESDSVTLNLKDQNHSCLFTVTDDDQYKSIVMPMRL